MKKFNLGALLLGAGLLMAMGTTTLSAKCGGEATKCGSEKAAKCGATKKAAKCGTDKAAAKCGTDKKAAKCGTDKAAAKCGGDKKAPKSAEKCGAGKCG
ncbi:MAG: hypothetical protein ACI9TV_000748 [Sulfurimonas sp.]|jgi:hypothetical protein|uniref:hypothetical protein n=1 Tax=Sulfurimonas sp. TaxID=2022749 RepID=UPI0039E3B736